MKQRAPRNKTITIQLDEKQELKNRLATVGTLRNGRGWTDCVIHGDIMDVLKEMPDAFADLIIIDPPYNLHGNSGNSSSRKKQKRTMKHICVHGYQMCAGNSRMTALFTCAGTGTAHQYCNASLPRISISLTASHGNVTKGAAQLPTGKIRWRISGLQ